MTCPTCGASADPAARFCSSCGHELRHLSDERRVVTVLFGDLVGFTTLSETRDPETVKNLVDRCFARLAADITAFGGTVDKVVGDAIVALFGAPVAHEDDAERAVRAALRMQQTLAGFVSEVEGAELRMRIGVNTGEVLVGALRAGGDYTVMGDVVNTAARIETSALPGEVLVGESTHAVTQQVVAYESRGLLQAKGREAPVETWVAHEALVPPGSRPRHHTVAMVGREREIGLLKGVVQGSAESSRAAWILLMGDAGVGKTRLAGEVATAALASGGLVLEGRCVPYGEANVWWPVAEAIRASCRVELTDPYDEARVKTRARVAESLGDADTAAEHDRVTTGLLHLMGFEQALPGVDPTNARDEAIRSLVAYIEGFARQFPILIVLSDLHWADDVVLELADSLLERLARCPVTLLATAREQLLDRWSPKPGRHNSIRLNLDPLGREAAGRLLTSLLGHEPTPELAQALLDRSGGNPFFLEELVSLMSDAAASGTSEAGVSTLPDTLRGLVAARLDGLLPDQRTILQDAAVLGPRGEVKALQIMTEAMHQEVDVDRVLASLVSDDLFELDQGYWSFRSDLVREVAYGTLTKVDRAKRHEGIARFVEAHFAERLSDNLVDRLANHYGVAAELTLQLGEPLDPDLLDRAVTWISAAAKRASDNEVMAVSNRLYSQALSLVGCEPSAHRRELLLGRSRARAEAWSLEDARADAEEALAEATAAGDELHQARAVMQLGDIDQKCGDLDDAVVRLTDAIARFEALGDQAGLALALRLRGMTELFRGSFAEAETSVRAAREAFQAVGDPQGDAWALQNLAWIAFVLGRVDEADERLQQAVAAFGEIGDAVGTAWALGLLAFVRMQQGRVEEAEAIAVPIRDEARERGDKWAAGIMTVLLGTLRLWAGRTDEAAKLAEDAYESFKLLGDTYGLSQSASLAARSYAMVGRPDDGLAVLEEVREVSAPSGFAGVASMVDAMSVILAVQLGNPDLFRRWAGGVELLEAGVANETLVVALAIGALQAGEIDRAVALMGRATESSDFDPVQTPELAGPAAMVLGAAGRRAEAIHAADAAGQSTRATYLDLALADAARALLLAAAGDAVALDWVQRCRRAVDGTGDRVAQLIARLAELAVRRRLGDRDIDALASEIQARQHHLGMGLQGWSTAFDAVLAGAAPEGVTSSSATL